MILKYISIVLLFVFLPCFGDENGIIPNIANSGTGVIQKECMQNNPYVIAGNTQLKIGDTETYTINSNFISVGENSKDIVYTLTKSGTKIQENKDENFNISFEEIGEYTLTAQIQETNTLCHYTLTKSINVYSKFISYISNQDESITPFDNDFKKNNILLNKVILEYKNSSSIQEDFLSKITNQLNTFQDADIIIIYADNYGDILQGFEKLIKIYNIDFSKKKIFIVTDSDFIVSKKLLSNFIFSLHSKIFTFSPLHILNFLSHISAGKSSMDMINNPIYKINEISFSEEKNPYLFLTNFINKIISSGFPISILGIILSLGVSVTVINFIRQFIGISIFNLYYPILFAISIYLFSFEISFILFIASLFAMYIMKGIYSQFHFLLNTKLTLFFILYMITVIVFIGILDTYEGVEFINLKSQLIIFPFIIIPMITYKVFYEENKIFSLRFFMYIGEFTFVTFISNYTIQSNYIQNILLSYPEILIGIFFLNLIIGKFTGLQLLEYIRFLPLIKKNFQQEE